MILFYWLFSLNAPHLAHTVQHGPCEIIPIKSAYVHILPHLKAKIFDIATIRGLKKYFCLWIKFFQH